MSNLKEMHLGSEPFRGRFLVYGPSGARKTTFAGTFPKPFIFDFDHKMKTLWGKDIEFESFNADSRDIAANEIDRFMKCFQEQKKNPLLETLIFDSLTVLDTFVIRWLMKKSGKIMARPEIQTYGDLKDFYEFLFMELNSASLKKNVVVVAHDEYYIDEDTGTHSIRPLITGKKIPFKLPAFFEETYFMQVVDVAGKQEGRLYYRPYKKAIANTQFLRGESGFIVDPTFDKLVELAKVGGNTDTAKKVG